jgi:hypothetical protein
VKRSLPLSSGRWRLLGGLAVPIGSALATVAVVNFETVPVEPTGPPLFASVPGPQTIVAPGIATFTGGVILGNAASFPGIVFATPPNVYGTANFGNGLSETLTITVDPSFPVTEVSFPIFNGETFTQSYTATAFSGATQVASQTLTNLPPNSSSGFGLIDLMAMPITSVTIIPTALPSSWDFLIDTVAFNESVEQAVGVPEPSSIALLGFGLLGTGLFELGVGAIRSTYSCGEARPARHRRMNGTNLDL